MHVQAKNFTLYVKSIFPEYFVNKNVLDVGSGDINGNNRFLFEECTYSGNDLMEAPNVTIISTTAALPFPDQSFDTIVSTECFEHDCEYEKSFKKIVSMLKDGGLFFFTCASTDRPEHGTKRTTPNDSYGTIKENPEFMNYYKNIELKDLEECISLDDIFVDYAAYYNKYTKDLYFWGLKKDATEYIKRNDEYKDVDVTLLKKK